MIDLAYSWLQEHALYFYILYGGGYLIIGGAFTFMYSRLYHELRNLLFRRDLFIPFILLRAASTPLLLFAWLWIIYSATPSLLAFWDGGEVHASNIQKTYQLGVLLLLAWAGMRCAKYSGTMLLSGRLTKEVPDERTVRIVIRLVYLIIGLGTLFYQMRMIALPIPGVVVVMGELLLGISGIILLLYLIYSLKANFSNYVTPQTHFLLHTAVHACTIPLIIFVIGSAALYLTRKTGLLHIPISQEDLFFLMVLVSTFRGSKLVEEHFLSDVLPQRAGQPGRGTVQNTAKLVRFLVILVFLFYLINRRGEITGMLSFFGGSAVALTLIGRQLLENYASGIIMSFEGHFRVGDWIYTVDKKTEGHIEYIGMRTTSIRTFDKRIEYIPNSFFTSERVVNASKMTNRRIMDVIPIARQSHQCIDQMTQQIRAMLQTNPAIDTNMNIVVHFTGFSEYALNITVIAYTKTKEWKTYRNVQQDVFLRIMKIIEESGAQLAVPPRSIHVMPLGYEPRVNIPEQGSLFQAN